MAGEVRYYTIEEAARVLRLTPERVREMLESGELEGRRTGDTGGWRIPIHERLGALTPAADVAAAEPAPPVDVSPPEVEISLPQETEDEPLPAPTTAGAEDRELPEEAGDPLLPAEALEETRQPAEIPRGEDPATIPEPTSESGWVTTQQAAKALGISARTVRWHIERGNIEAKPEGEGVERTWRVSVDSLHAFRDSRKRRGQSPRDHRAPAPGVEVAAVDPGSAIRELADRLVEEARRAEAARVRLELAERAQSSLEAELTEERRRREEAERQRREAEMERDAARRELDTLQQRREEASQTPPSPGRASTSTPPPERGAPQRSVEPVPETRIDAAATAAGPLKPPQPHQEPPPQVDQRRPPVPGPVPGRRGWLRRIFRG